MSRKDKHGGKINPETKNSVIAVSLIGLAAILILAVLGKAGPVGKLVFFALNNLFGWGYYLLPTIAVLIALLFLLSRQRVFIGTSLIGAFLFVMSGLGFIDIIFEKKGGLLGNAVGFLEIPFGYIASIIVTALAAVAAMLLAFNASIKFSAKTEKGVDEEEKTVPSPEIDKVMVAEPETPKPAKAAAAKIEKEDAAVIVPVTANLSAHQSRRFQVGTPTAASGLKTKTANYTPPPLELLKSSVEKPSAGDLRANANIIKRTLESFGIPVEMGEINIGPKVTRYTLKPAEGVKLSRITALNQDLSLALAAHPIRIEAPIPGKSLVGIEVPNKSAAIVRLGSLMAYPEFKESGSLAFVLGRGISGELILADIDKMPHLLIAGSTGSGKSVGIHAMLVSLLYKNSPATLRLALIDPKRVELSVYKNIPHLIAPVITDGKKTIGLFRWAIQEMERRYEVLLAAGARDIGSYNQKSGTPLPYLLIVIDELADLMAAHGKEIEGSIVRLAQMARATGIHLVVSTQRPSVEVITGLIKANITARVALQVASQVDSRTILDISGAEKLLGGGDMLFVSSEFSKPKRIQGAYISEEEIQKVANFVADNNEPIDAYEFLPESARTENADFASPEEFLKNDEWQQDDDELVDQAIEVVREAKKASASLLQRRLKVGYARAARLLDIMEEKGLIGPGDGAKPREVFIDKAFINKEGGDIN